MKNYYYQWVGISEANTFVSTSLLLISRPNNAGENLILNNIIEKYSLLTLENSSLVLYNTMSTDTKINTAPWRVKQ